MNITVNPDIEKRIEELVERGEYPSADAVVNDALGSFLDFDSEEDLDHIRRRIAIAEAEIDRGEFVECEVESVHDLARDVHRRGLEKLKKLSRSGPEE